MIENKSAYFVLKLNLSKQNRTEFYEEKINNSLDLIYNALDISDKNNHIYRKKNGEALVHYFKTNNRKRKGMIDKYCQRFLPDDQTWQIIPIKQNQLNAELDKIKENKGYRLQNEVLKDQEYNGEDIKIFDNRETWYSWQKEIYKMFFDSDNQIIKPHDRKIHHVVCLSGNSGKSSFFKWLYFHNQEDIGRITYGTATQLRTSLINTGAKKLYIVDLARSKSRQDSEQDLLAAIEDLKSGIVLTSMYGSSKKLLMNPPAILISSNYVFGETGLSEDRWCVYEVESKNKSLGKKNKLLLQARTRHKKKKRISKMKRRVDKVKSKLLDFSSLLGKAPKVIILGLLLKYGHKNEGINTVKDYFGKINNNKYNTLEKGIRVQNVYDLKRMAAEIKKDLGFQADIIFEKPSPISIKIPSLMEGGKEVFKRIDIFRFFKPSDQGDQNDYKWKNSNKKGEIKIKINKDEIKIKPLKQVEIISLEDILEEYEE
jgi:hypothetical protein